MRTIKLYVAEEQQILLDAYQPYFLSHPGIELVGASGDTEGMSVAEAASALKPDVVLLGIKTLQPASVEKLETLREICPDAAVIVLAATCELNGIKALRHFAADARGGCAYLLKQNIDSVEQLAQVILTVAQARVLIDPAVMVGLMSVDNSRASLIKDLSPRELEVLSWMAKGYRNNTIAEVLGLEAKTVERHINSIFSKLCDPSDSRHPRVHAVTLYLRAMGSLVGDELLEG